MFYIGSHVVLLKFALPHERGRGRRRRCERLFEGRWIGYCVRPRPRPARHRTARHSGRSSTTTDGDTDRRTAGSSPLSPFPDSPSPHLLSLCPACSPDCSSCSCTPSKARCGRRRRSSLPKRSRACDGRTDGRPAVVAHRPAVPRLSARFAADRRRLAPGDGCHLFIYDRQTDRAGSCPPAQLAG